MAVHSAGSHFGKTQYSVPLRGLLRIRFVAGSRPHFHGRNKQIRLRHYFGTTRNSICAGKLPLATG
jgi:hypothetical protein